MSQHLRRFVLTASSFLFVMPAWAADVSRFPLSKAVPADVFVMVAGRHNPEREFLDQYWSKVFDAFSRSGVVEEIWELATSSMPEADAKSAEEFSEKFCKLIEQVRWGEIFAKESVYCVRAGFPTWDNLVLAQASPDAAESNFAGLKAILTEVAKMHGSPAEVKESKFEGATLCRLSFGPEVPFSVTLARRNNVLALAIGESLLKDSLSLLAGRDDKSALVATERFKNALASLPDAEDEIVFFDAARMMGDLKKMFAALVKKVGDEHKSNGDPDEEDPSGKILTVLGRVIDDLSIWDYSVTTNRTQGYSTIAESVTVLMPGAKSRRGYRAFVPAAKFENLDRLVPKEAADFSVSDGLNLLEIYDWVLSLVRDEIPDGKAYLAQWAEFQKEHEFDLRRDVLECLEGPMISVTLPGGGFGGNGWVTLIKVKSEKIAAKQIKRLIDLAQKAIGEQQGLVLSDVAIDGHESFHSVSHPFMMMLQVPPIIWGTADGYLIFGSSAKPIATCLKTLAGEHPGISQNPRFKKEGVAPKGAFTAASFTDTSKTADELRAALTGITMGMGMMTTFAPVQSEEGGKFLKAIPSITGKLVVVANRLNFFLSESSATSFDGKAWRTTTIANYKDPKSIKEPADDAENDTDDDGHPGADSKRKERQKVEDEDDDQDEDE